MHRPPVLALLCATVLLGASEVRAARPLITDDARIVDSKACQLETWMRRNRGSTEYWALPACNFTGDLELTFGGGRTAEFGETTTSDVQLQGKRLFKRLEPDGWGVGMVIGNLRRPAEMPHRDVAGNLYGYIPASVSFNRDRLVVHANLGMARPDNSPRHRPTWGVGAEVSITDAVYFIPEVFSQGPGRPQFQAGIRYWLVPDRVQLDATYGDRLGRTTDGRWFSLGLRLLTPAFLP